MMQNRSHKLVPSHPLLGTNLSSSEEFMSHASNNKEKILYDPNIKMLPNSSSEQTLSLNLKPQ